jgi:hypothetical protein
MMARAASSSSGVEGPMILIWGVLKALLGRDNDSPV